MTYSLNNLDYLNQTVNIGDHPHPLVEKLFLVYFISGGVEKWYLTRLITSGNGFDSCLRHTHKVGVAQLVERGTHKPEVVGSIPTPDTMRL